MQFATPDQTLFADVRGNRHAAAITALPFVPHRYKRTKAGGTHA
jgi:hypothetical protein